MATVWVKVDERVAFAKAWRVQHTAAIRQVGAGWFLLLQTQIAAAWSRRNSLVAL